jgi:hypothetical protein
MSAMLVRRLVALVLDLLVIAAGGGGGLLLALLAVESRNTIASMGNIVVVFMLAAGGAVLAWLVLVGLVTLAGRSPGQRIAGLGYDGATTRMRRACHCLLAWLVPVVLATVPALSLDAIEQYRSAALERWETGTGWKRRYHDLTVEKSDLDYAYRSGALKDSLTEAEYLKRMRDYDSTIESLQRERARALWWAPHWLAEIDGIPWLLLAIGPVFLYLLASLILLWRPPHAAAHDFMTGVRIVAASR